MSNTVVARIVGADPTKVITGEAVLSYPHLDKPQPSNDGKPPKYSATLVFPKGSDLTLLKKAAIAAGVKKFGATYTLPNGQVITFEQAMVEGIFKNPFRKDGLAKGYPEGSVFINARSTQPVGVVYAHAGPDGKPAKVPLEKIRADLYAGAIVLASVSAFGYDNSGNKGVSFSLNNIQKLRDGARIDNRVNAEDEFTVDLSQAPADLSSLI
jgi:hypothetical protein